MMTKKRGANLYAKLLGGLKEFHGSAEDSLKVISFRRADAPPEGYLPYAIEGEATDAVSVTIEDGRIVKRYVTSTAVVSTYSKSLLARGIIERGKLQQLNAMMEASADLAFYWNSFTEFDDTDPAWPMMSSAVREGLSMTEAEWQVLLDEARV